MEMIEKEKGEEKGGGGRRKRCYQQVRFSR
jgi:hypothetical protein